MDKEYFSWNDAWVFTAFYKSHQNDEKINLQKIIETGDSLNHAIFNPGEVISAFDKFQKKRIVKINNLIVTITDIGKEIIQKCEKTKGGLFSRVNISLKKLNSNRNKYIENENIIDLSEFVTTHFKESYEKYSKSATYAQHGLCDSLPKSSLRSDFT